MLLTYALGLNQHHVEQDAAEDAYRGPQALQDIAHTTVLHAEGTLHAAKLPRPLDDDPHGVPQDGGE